MAKVDVIMPQMGESIAEGTLTKWLKREGEEVERDEDLFEISTDKVDADIPSPSSGVLAEILVAEGETVEVGTRVARIETEAVAAAADGGPPAKAVEEAPVQAPPPEEPPAQETPATEPRAVTQSIADAEAPPAPQAPATTVSPPATR
ncbi:MAG: biotin/lipoyl-containing protein, partial [Gemmatimonadota bacterium]